MNFRKGLLYSLIAAAGAVSTSGCASMDDMNPKRLLHNLQPHRLWKANHGISGMPAEDYSTSNDRGPSQSGGFFASVSDALPSQSNVPAHPTDRRP